MTLRCEDNVREDCRAQQTDGRLDERTDVITMRKQRRLTVRRTLSSRSRPSVRPATPMRRHQVNYSSIIGCCCCCCAASHCCCLPQAASCSRLFYLISRCAIHLRHPSTSLRVLFSRFHCTDDAQPGLMDAS